MLAGERFLCATSSPRVLLNGLMIIGTKIVAAIDWNSITLSVICVLYSEPIAEPTTTLVAKFYLHDLRCM